MRRVVSFACLLSFSLVVIYSCSAPARSVSSKKDTIIIVDGKSNEWGNNFQYDRASKLQYALSKDEKNLYICLKSTDQTLENKIKTFGLTLWIDTTGKHKEKMGVRYPIGNKGLSSSKNNKEKKNEAESRQEFLNGTRELEVKGFPILKDYGNEFTRLDAKSKLGIHAALDFDSLSTMLYEIKIPYTIILQGATPKNVTLKFLTGSLDIDSKRENFDVANRPGSVTTGMNGYATGGGGNLANVPGSREYFDIMSPSELKLNINLSAY